MDWFDGLNILEGRTMSDIQAGWYPAPDDPTQLQYWDGSAWTVHRAVSNAAAAAPVAAAPVVAAPTPPAAPAEPVAAALVAPTAAAAMAAPAVQQPAPAPAAPAPPVQNPLAAASAAPPAPPITGIPPIVATSTIPPMTAPSQGNLPPGSIVPGVGAVGVTTLAPMGGPAQPIAPTRPPSSRGKTIGLIIGGIVLVIAAFFAGRLTAPDDTASTPGTPAPVATQPAFVVPGATQPAAPAPVPGATQPAAPVDPNAPGSVPVNPGFIIPTTAP